jgi:4-hydroxy-tetrahydrodipicolinate synthase
MSMVLQGVLPVLHTPLLDDSCIDYQTLQKEIDWVFQTQADGVVVAMVSEVLRLGYRRRKELASQVCQMAKGLGAIVISVGSESIYEALEFAEDAQKHGASAVMAIPPVATSLSGDRTGRLLRSNRPVHLNPAGGPRRIELRRCSDRFRGLSKASGRVWA